ncbi:LAFA_0E06150g1_1 [Lachancea sp. 'fantastica']|nr:LAFA_0E06150g1_1 [Lachancea sp. 'fantastica']
MSMEFSSRDYASNGYSRARPTYPVAFFKQLSDFHQGKRDLLIDVGCGPGKFTLELAQNLQFQDVYGTDVSPGMIDAAIKEKGAGKKTGTVQFSVHAAEDLDWVPAGTADMVTAAQCCHWLDFEAFETAVFRALRNRGSLAIWGYVDPSFTDFPELDTAIDELQYGTDQLGPYWEKPGRDILRGLLQSQRLDPKRFDDIIEVLYWSRNSKIPTTQLTHKPLRIDCSMTVAQFQDYIGTWSAYNAWKRANKNTQPDVRERFIKQVKATTRLRSESLINVTWNTVFKFARKRTRL